MRLYYLANARIPTEKAHGLTIVKSCEAFARAGAEVVLVVPRRKTQFREDLYATYGVEKNFSVRYLPVIDALRFSSGRFAFLLSFVTFYISAFFFLLFSKRGVLYTRDAPLLTLSFLMPAFLECHHIFGRQERYFSLARRAQGIITISRSLKEKFIASKFDGDRIFVSPSGVDLDTFALEISKTDARDQLSLPREENILLYTGNFTTMGEDKGITTILHALEDIHGAHFFAVGGSVKDIAHYRTEAENLGLSGRAHFVSYQPQKLLALYQRAADILLMPFPDTEHYRSNMSPVKMFEYMASGRPVIASDLPTIREVLTKDNAVLVEPGNHEALAHAITQLFEHSAQADALAEEAKRDVAVYSWDEKAKRTLAFIEARR